MNVIRNLFKDKPREILYIVAKLSDRKELDNAIDFLTEHWYCLYSGLREEAYSSLNSKGYVYLGIRRDADRIYFSSATYVTYGQDIDVNYVFVMDKSIFGLKPFYKKIDL